MNRKDRTKASAGITIYYGIGAIIGFIGGLIGLGFWSFNVYTGQTDFSWESLIGLVLITLVFGFVGYFILRVGYEELGE